MVLRKPRKAGYECFNRFFLQQKGAVLSFIPQTSAGLRLAADRLAKSPIFSNALIHPVLDES
jgi:hypothetical protein